MSTAVSMPDPAEHSPVRDPIVIYRRKRRPTGKATYWATDERYGTIQINSDRAKGLVAIGAAVWSGDPIVTEVVKE